MQQIIVACTTCNWFLHSLHNTSCNKQLIACDNWITIIFNDMRLIFVSQLVNDMWHVKPTLVFGIFNQLIMFTLFKLKFYKMLTCGAYVGR